MACDLSSRTGPQRPGGLALGVVVPDGAGGGDEVLTPGRPPGAAPDHGEALGFAGAGVVAGVLVVGLAGGGVAGAAAGGEVTGVGVVAGLLAGLLSTGTSERPGAAGDGTFSAFAFSAAFASAARRFFSARIWIPRGSHTAFALRPMRPPNSEK